MYLNQLNMRTAFFFLFLNLISQTNFAQPIGIFQNHADIGKPKNTGTSGYKLTDDAYIMKGAGYNIWFNRDEFQYLYKKIGGDFILTAQFEWIGDKGNNHRKYGWMIRESLDEAAGHVSAVSHGDGLTVMQWRVLRGAFMRDPEDEIFFAKKGFEIIQMERIGKQITMRVAHPGEPLQTVGSYKAEMRDSVFAGLYICSHDSSAIEQVKVWNVRIEKPIVVNNKGDYTPEFSRKNETVNIIDGKRSEIILRDSVQKVYFTTREAIVPGFKQEGDAVSNFTGNKKVKNYTSDYEYVTQNVSSQIWRMKSSDNSQKEQITFDEYNNSHPEVSPDGKYLAFISYTSNIENKSLFRNIMIRIMPLAGGISLCKK